MNICVYCASSTGFDVSYLNHAIALGKMLAQNNHALVYGAGKVGVMGVLADTVMEHGGKAIGVIPRFMVKQGLCHPNLSECHVCPNMASRKKKMMQLGDVLLAFIGGPGTLEEIVEAISWVGIGKNSKPCIVFNLNGYFNPLLDMYRHMVAQGFMDEQLFNNIIVVNTLSELEQTLKTLA